MTLATLTWEQLAELFTHFALLSMVAVGGAITTASDMQRYLVGEKQWLSTSDFNASIAIAQAAPGPNVLFVALMGLGAGGMPGLLAAMAGIMLPSSLVAMQASRWLQRNASVRGVRAFNQGLAPLAIGLLLATTWVLLSPLMAQPSQRLGAAAVALAAVSGVTQTKASPVWFVALGGVAGAFGWL